MNSLVDYGSSSDEETSSENERVSTDDINLEKLQVTKTTTDSTNAEKRVKSSQQHEKENTAVESENEELIGPPIPSQFTQNKTRTTTELENDELVGPPIPSQFSQNETGTTAELENDDLIGPPIPSQFSSNKTEAITDQENGNSTTNSKNKTESDESDDETEELKLPITDSVDFKHGSKAVTALAVDPTGTRFVSGSLDYEVRFWDFIGMNSSLQSFRSLYPCGNNPIKSLTYSSTGDAILVVSGMSQAKVLDRDGHEKLECVKGDQYISDMVRTKGHTAPLTDGCWHPRIREQFLTSSEDSTVRVWNVTCATQHKSIIKCKSKSGLKTTPTTCTYNREGTMIACVCFDGSFQLWDTRKMFVSPAKVIRDAHQNGTETSRVSFSYSGNYACTRGCDETMKLWDMRMFKNPVRIAGNLFSRYPSTDCMFSPRDDVIVTGVSLDRGEKDGRLLFFNTNTFEIEDEIIPTDSHVIKTQWHPRLNQIFVGCGNGLIKVYYGQESAKGAKLCANKKPKKAKQVETAVMHQIITPHALPMFRQDRPKSIRKQMEKARLDPVKSRRPDLPIKSGQGGRVAATGSTLSSYVIRNLGLSKRVEDDQDPREAILKYAKEAAENPYWIAPAYKKTQPKAIFAAQEEDEDEPSEKKQKIL